MIKRIGANGDNGVRDNCIFAARKQRITSCFNDGITAVAGIVCRISIIYSNAGQAGAPIEFINLFLPIIYALNDRKVMA